jgi:hypothetical protein
LFIARVGQRSAAEVAHADEPARLAQASRAVAAATIPVAQIRTKAEIETRIEHA